MTFPRIISTMLISAIFAIPAFAAVGAGDLEVLQVNATVQYHSKHYDECMNTLKQILKTDPKNIPALELTALVHRNQNQDEAAAATYEQLMHAAPKEKKAAYSFDLATIRFKQKKLKEARQYFNIAANQNFNPGTSHFFMGLMDFNAKNWKPASKHLAASLSYSDAASMRPVARYYLANAYSQQGRSEAAIRSYADTIEATINTDAKKGAHPTGLTGDLRKNAVTALKTFNKSQKFVSLTLLSQWDNNVALLPGEITTGQLASGKKTAKSVFSGVVGYNTSPTKRWQAIASMTAFTNYNLNADSRELNFFSPTPSVYVLYKPYARLSPGMKFEGTYSMKNQFSSSDNKTIYRSYSLTGDVGPVVKFELNPKITFAYEATWRPKKFYLDTATGDDRRSGHGFFTRLSNTINSSIPWWSPTSYLTYEFDNTFGKTYRFDAIGIGFSNPVDVTDDLTLTGSIDITDLTYDQAAVKRDDTMLTIRALGSYNLTSHWAAVADMSLTKNDSNIPATFRYQRFVASLGASYIF